VTVTIELPYGEQKLPVSCPDEIEWELPPPPDSRRRRRPEFLARQGAASLVRQLRQRGASTGERVLLVVPDTTRRCGLETLLPPLIAGLVRELAAPIEIAVATGSHPPPTPADLAALLGTEALRRCPVHVHDAHNGSELHDFGPTRAGTPVWLNRVLLSADWIVTVNAVVLHYFAGLGGGPKMVLPGLAGLETITANHRRALTDRGGFAPGCREGHTSGNPVWEDLAEVVPLFPRWLSLQVVLDRQGQLTAVHAGPPIPVQQRLSRILADTARVPLRRPADIVLAGTGPAGINLVQAHKAIHHACLAARPGGVVIVCAPCPQGIGSDSFLAWFARGRSEEIAAGLSRGYTLNGHTALALRQKSERFHLIFHSSLPAEVVSATGMIPVTTLARAWEIARSFLPAGPLHGVILEDAAATMPQVQEEGRTD